MNHQQLSLKQMARTTGEKETVRENSYLISTFEKCSEGSFVILTLGKV